MALNDKWAQALSALERLDEDWDGEGALPPYPQSLAQARATLNALCMAGAPIFHLCAGPNGEIAIDLKQGEKEVHLLFEPSRVTYFLSKDTCYRSKIRMFTDDVITELIEWLNS